MKQYYVWLIWSSAFLVSRAGLYLVNTRLRTEIWRAGLTTALFGLTEPFFVPAYWNPPSLFELAQRTDFDIESLILSFVIGGIGAVLYDTLTSQHIVAATPVECSAPLHRFHLAALLVSFVLFVPLLLLP